MLTGSVLEKFYKLSNFEQQAYEWYEYENRHIFLTSN